MQELKKQQASPFTIDKAWLAEHPPALLLTQDACQACDVDTSLVAQVFFLLPSWTEVETSLTTLLFLLPVWSTVGSNCIKQL